MCGSLDVGNPDPLCSCCRCLWIRCCCCCCCCCLLGDSISGSMDTVGSDGNSSSALLGVNNFPAGELFLTSEGTSSCFPTIDTTLSSIGSTRLGDFKPIVFSLTLGPFPRTSPSLSEARLNRLFSMDVSLVRL